MSAPRYLVETPLAESAPGSRLVLDGDEGRHAATVRRTRRGERLDVADGTGRVAHCLVDAVAAGRIDLLVEAVSQVPAREPSLVLVQALAKGGRDELAVETATELGVDALVPWQADRSVVIWSGERGERALRKWRSVARAAAKQSRRASVPSVQPLVGTAALADRVRTVVAAGGVALVLHEEADESLLATPIPAVPIPAVPIPAVPIPAVPIPGPPMPAEPPAIAVLVVVGPEGGIAPDELAVLRAAGGRAVRLGPEVLRSSSAGPAALAVLSARLGRWGRWGEPERVSGP